MDIVGNVSIYIYYVPRHLDRLTTAALKNTGFGLELDLLPFSSRSRNSLASGSRQHLPWFLWKVFLFSTRRLHTTSFWQSVQFIPYVHMRPAQDDNNSVMIDGTWLDSNLTTTATHKLITRRVVSLQILSGADSSLQQIRLRSSSKS